MPALPSGPCGCYRGSLGLGSPRFRAGVVSRPAVLCVATTAFVHPGRFAFGSLPVPWLTHFDLSSWLSPRLARRERRRLAGARVLVTPVTSSAMSPKETGALPSSRVTPLTHASVSDPGGVPLACLDASRAAAFRRMHTVGFGPVARTYPVIHDYTIFGLNSMACVLALPLLRTGPSGTRLWFGCRPGG